MVFGKKIEILFAVLFIFCAALWADEKRYVNCKKLDLRATNTNFAKKTGTVNYGDELTVISENNNWFELKSENGIKGWAQGNNLSKRKISSSNFSIRRDELALGGKGFGEELEEAYKSKAISANYYQINATEKLKIADVELEKFMIEGKLKFISDENKSEWKNLITSISNAFSSAASILPESYFGETFTVEQKYYIGRAVCANILAKYKIRNSSKAQKYLGEICQALVLNSEQPELFNGWSIFILDSDEVNAFATSGGHIMLTRGLLKSASSEDELAAVIAHEISHVILGHSIKSIETNKKVSGLVNVWNSAVDAGEKYFSENVNKAFEGFSNTVEDFAFNFIEKGYSQKQEFEADSKALEIMSVAGYNPKAMKTMLENLEANETKSKEMKNHPSAESRLSNVELRLKFLKSESGGEAQRDKRFLTVNKSF